MNKPKTMKMAPKVAATNWPKPNKVPKPGKPMKTKLSPNPK